MDKVAGMKVDMEVDLVVVKVANMKVDKVADMKVDMVVDMGVDKVANMDFSIIFWAFLCDFFCISQCFFFNFL